MPFKPGQSGNPHGVVKQKQFLAALERVIAQDSAKGLRDIAEKVYALARAGEEWAIQFLADRLDGKPTQQLDMRVTRPTKELSDDELADIAAGSSEGVVASTDSEEKPSQLH
jgi:hypothetical protein